MLTGGRIDRIGLTLIIVGRKSLGGGSLRRVFSLPSPLSPLPSPHSPLPSPLSQVPFFILLFLVPLPLSTIQATGIMKLLLVTTVVFVIPVIQRLLKRKLISPWRKLAIRQGVGNLITAKILLFHVCRN